MNKQNNIDDLFRQAREQQPRASFNETKNLFLNSLDSQKANLNDAKKGKVFTFKNSIIMSTIIGVIAVLSTIFFVTDSPKAKEEQKNLVQVKTKIEEKETNEKQSPAFKKENSSKINAKKQNIELNSQNKGPISVFVDAYSEMTRCPIQTHPHNPIFIENTSDDYTFPKLTEQEIQKTKKQKKKMLKALAKMDRDYYSYIPSGSFEYKGNIISVQAFYMQKTEVSNLEYRTYLFDLLINDKKEEFLKAKPNQQAWKIALVDSAQYMIDNYFSNEIYDDYPVNNISREGAELYCKWISKELINYVGEKDAACFMDMRIPTRQEWVKAASVEGLYKEYPFEGELYQSKLNFYTANFNLHGFKGPIKKGYENKLKDSLFPSSKTYGETKPVYTWKYTVVNNGYGMYNLCGNVAEMVVDCPNNIPKVNDTIPKQNRILTPGTAGGGWMNSAEEIKINAPDNHPNVIEAHPNIGFRVVTTHLGKGAYNINVR